MRQVTNVWKNQCAFETHDAASVARVQRGGLVRSYVANLTALEEDIRHSQGRCENVSNLYLEETPDPSTVFWGHLAARDS